MRKLLYFVIFLPYFAFAAALSPVGYWQQINEANNQPQSIIEIWQEENGSLSGKILGLYPVKGRELQKYCTKCSDARRDQPIIGMTILQNMRVSTDPLTWVGGEILDPKAGSLYRCRLNLAKNDQILNVRGYLGVPLLGRSQAWHRLSPDELKQALKNVKTTT